MDYDEAMNISSFDTYDEMSAEMSRVDLPREITFTIFFLVGILADIAIIYTIFHFRRMQTVPKIFLANWAIADMCSLIVTPSTYRIISVIDSFSIPRGFICFLEEWGSSLHINVLLFVTIVLIDWFIGAHFGRASERFRSHYRGIIAGVWLLTIALATTTTGICIAQDAKLHHQAFQLIICYLTNLLLIIVFQCSRIVNKYRKITLDYPTLPLTLATVFISVSFLSAIALIWYASRSCKVFEIIGTCLLFSSSIFNLTLLYVFDKDFHACMLQALRRSGDRYEESISDIGDSIRVTDDKVPFRIALHRNEDLSLNECQ